MNNSSLVDNTDRIYGGQQKPLGKKQEYVDDQPQYLVWLKIIGLFVITYGLMAAFMVISKQIQYFSNNLHSDFVDGGGVILGIFLLYVIIIGVAWALGSARRQQMKREAVQEQLRKEKQLDIVDE